MHLRLRRGSVLFRNSFAVSLIAERALDYSQMLKALDVLVKATSVFCEFF